MAEPSESLMHETLSDIIKPSKGLYSLSWYLSWEPGDSTATLDGEFSASDLECIAAHIRKHDVQS